MASSQPHKQPRDQHLLFALYLTPLTVEQALRWSKAWPEPFQSWKVLHKRLEKLRSADWLCRWRYAIASRGASPSYYKLTAAGYRILCESDKAAPRRNFRFGRIAPALHRHTHSLAELIVKLFVAADRQRLIVTQAFPENAVSIPGDGPSLFADFAHQMNACGRALNFCWERDCSTESIRSVTNLEAITWKLRRYEAAHYAASHNYRVVFFCESRQRAQNIIDEARRVFLEPRREIVYACSIGDFLQSDDPLRQRMFLSNRGRPAALLPKYSPAAHKTR